MTTCNIQRPSLLHSKLVGVQSGQDNQGYKEMEGHCAMIANKIRLKNIGLEKQQKTLLINIMRFMLPNVRIM